MLNDDRKTVDESYASAGHSSNLKMEADRRGAVDVLAAAGLSPHIVGGQLLRLRTEYDGAEHPRITTAAQFMVQGADKAGRHQAGILARKHNLHETGLMLGKLKSLPGARTMLANQLTYWGAQDAETTAVAVLRWWLNPVCHECNGTKYEVVPNTGRLSAKACKGCDATGLARIPRGQEGRRLANWVEMAIQHSRNSISKRLRNR